MSITNLNGQRTDGTVTELTQSSLTIALNDADTQRFPLTTVWRITLRDSPWNGGLIGLVAGMIPATAVGTAFVSYMQHDPDGGRCDEKHNCSNPLAGGLAIGLVFGGLPGLAIDAGIEETIDVVPSRRTAWRVAPVVGPDRKGVMVSVRW